MENAEECLKRAAADRAQAEATTLPREREVRMQSAKRWEEMARMAARVAEEALTRSEATRQRSDEYKQKKLRRARERAAERRGSAEPA